MSRDRQTSMRGRIRFALYFTAIFFSSALTLWRTQQDITARVSLIGFGLTILLLIDGTVLYLYIQSKRRNAADAPVAGVAGLSLDQDGQPASSRR